MNYHHEDVLITCGTWPPFATPSGGFTSQGAGILATSAKFKSARASFNLSRSFIAILARHLTSLSFVRFIPVQVRAGKTPILETQTPSKNEDENVQVAMVSLSSSMNGLPVCNRSSWSA